MYHFEMCEKQNLEKVFRLQVEVFSFIAVQMRMMLQLMHHIRTAQYFSIKKSHTTLCVMQDFLNLMPLSCSSPGFLNFILFSLASLLFFPSPESSKYHRGVPRTNLPPHFPHGQIRSSVRKLNVPVLFLPEGKMQ